MESKSDTCNSRKCVYGDGGVDKQDLLILSDFMQNNLLCDAVLRLEDGGVFPVHTETLSKCSEYFRFVWLLILLTNL
jgi:kelch-like protein 10